MPSTCTGLFSGEAGRQAPGLGCTLVRLVSLVLKFRSQLISQNWGPATGPRGAEHPNFPLMQQSYSTFKYYSHFLFKGKPFF